MATRLQTGPTSGFFLGAATMLLILTAIVPAEALPDASADLDSLVRDLEKGMMLQKSMLTETCKDVASSPI